MWPGERGVDAASSLHGDALRQVAGTIDWSTQPIGDVVGEQLEVDVREDGFDGRRHVRKCEHVVALRRRGDVVGDDGNQGHAAGRRFADVLSDASVCTASPVRSANTGVLSVSRASSPCFNSPAPNPSECL
jgi:hypothetical protein